MLVPSFAMTPEEMGELLASHAVHHLPPDFGGIAEAINEESHRQGLPPDLVLAVIEAESEFRADAVSDRGAVGLMQLMPSTAEELAAELNMPWTGEELLRDPRINIKLGTLYLRKMLWRFHDLDHALAAYNRGPYASGEPIPGGETATYTRRVKALFEQPPVRTPRRSFGGPTPFAASTWLTL